MKKVRHILKNGQRLVTKNSEETKFIFVRDVEYRKYGKTTRRIIEVQCDCGRKREVQYNNVRGGFSTSCGFAPCRLPANTGNRNIETGYNALWYSYRKGAEERKLSFELTKDEFKKFLAGNCYYCDDPPSSIYQIKNSRTGEIRAGIPIVYNGIDRVDNYKGYTMENSVSCCGTCNKMKTAHSADFFLEHIRKIYNHKLKT